jgi:hypothetical protein
MSWIKEPDYVDYILSRTIVTSFFKNRDIPAGKIYSDAETTARLRDYYVSGERIANRIPVDYGVVVKSRKKRLYEYYREPVYRTVRRRYAVRRYIRIGRTKYYATEFKLRKAHILVGTIKRRVVAGYVYPKTRKYSYERTNFEFYLFFYYAFGSGRRRKEYTCIERYVQGFGTSKTPQQVSNAISGLRKKFAELFLISKRTGKHKDSPFNRVLIDILYFRPV